MKQIRLLSRCLAKLDKHALKHRPSKHVRGWAPVFTAAWISILEWEDRSLPWDLVKGFKVVGRISPSGVMMPIPHEDEPDSACLEKLLGAAAVEFADELEADTRVHPHAREILSATEEEMALGLMHGFETREQLDNRFGKGNWRAIRRRGIQQGEKVRGIDISLATHDTTPLTVYTSEIRRTPEGIN